MNKGLIINEDVWPMIDDLEVDEKAELLSALSAYYQGNDLPEISRIAAVIYKRIALDNARFDPERRKMVSEVRAEAGRIGGSKPKQNKQTEANGSKTSKIAQEENREDKEKIKNRVEERVRFAPPTAEQVNEYATKFGMKIDAQRFVDFYSSKGWKVGSSPMKDWQAAVRNWVSRDKKDKKDDKSDLIKQIISRTYGEAST